MTSHFRYTRRKWIFFFLFIKTPLSLLVLAIASSLASAAPPIERDWVETYQAIEGCQDVWVIDARYAPTCGDLAAGMSDLRFFRAEQRGIVQFWNEYSQDEFLAASDSTLPTTYFFHGYGMVRPGAIISGERVADYMGQGAPPFRLVIWVWPARHKLLRSARRNLSEKITSANAQGYYLASLLQQSDPGPAVTLAGHSFGARCTLAALQGMAVGHVNEIPLPGDGVADQRRIQLTLLAPAVSSDALSDSGEFFLATSQVDRTLVTVNDQDVSLNLMARVGGDGNILGLTGPYNYQPGSNVYMLDTQPYIGRRHRVSHFLWSQPVAETLKPFMVYRP